MFSGPWIESAQQFINIDISDENINEEGLFILIFKKIDFYFYDLMDFCGSLIEYLYWNIKKKLQLYVMISQHTDGWMQILKSVSYDVVLLTTA